MKKNKYLMVIAFGMAISCTNRQPDMSSIKSQFLDVAYADLSKSQKMDVFLPEGQGPFPAVMLIHGGGFAKGDKSMEYIQAKKLVENGYVAVSINYRLSGEAKFPAALHDCKAALRFMKAHAEDYKLNAGKIGTWGASAGGNLSAMMGTTAGNMFADGTVGDYTNTNTNVQACIDWFGPINFGTMVAQAKELDMRNNFNVKIESKYMGVDANDPANAELIAKANPTTYLDENDPPFWVEVGSEDPLIPYLQSQMFAEELKRVLGEDRVAYEVVEGAGHGGKLFYTDENLDKAIAFFDKHLK